jgi:hypothetical protein
MSRCDLPAERSGSSTSVRRSSHQVTRRHLLQGNSMRGFSFKVASGLADVVAALRLVHACYVDLGLMDPHPAGLRLLPHHLLSDTRVFLARELEETVATLTLIPDTPFGLPLDDAYRDRIDELRRQGRRPVELSCLALAPRYRRHDLLLYLFQLMHVFARGNGYDDLCVVVAPKHGRFYRDILLFEPFGEFLHLDKLNGAPAVLFRQNLRTIEKTTRAFYDGADPRSDLYRLFFLNHPTLTPEVGSGRALDGEEVRHLVAMCPDVVASLARREWKVLLSLVDPLHTVPPGSDSANR